MVLGISRESNLIWERNEHKRVARPYMQMVRVEQEDLIAADGRWFTNGHLELQIFVRDIFLLIIHAVKIRETMSQYAAGFLEVDMKEEKIRITHRTTLIS